MKKAIFWTAGIVSGLCIVLIIAIIVGVSIDEQSTENKSTRAAEKAEDKRKGFHCLSAWDGHHDGFEALVKANLKDPSSMETHGTKITPVNDLGQHTIIMDFGARNSFGGMVRQEATGWVANETCEATLLSVE